MLKLKKNKWVVWYSGIAPDCKSGNSGSIPLTTLKHITLQIKTSFIKKTLL
jgi:hypothetical protein